LLSAALTEPFFARPADAVANGVAAVLVAVTYSSTVGQTSGASADAINVGKLAVATYGLLVAAVGILAIFTKDGPRAAVSQKASRLCRVLGSGRVVYSGIYLLSVYATYSRDPATLGVLFATWIVVVIVRPGDGIARYSHRHARPGGHSTVVGVRNPGLVEVQAPGGSPLQGGEVLRFGRDIEGIVLDVSANESGTWALVSVAGGRLPSMGDVCRVEEGRPAEDRTMLGVVEPGSDLQSIRVRAPGNVARVREGSVIRVALRGEDVLYQVVSAVIRRESLSSPTEHRFLEIAARKIGRWVAEEDRFRSVPWLPEAGFPTHLDAARITEVRADYIGTIPETAYGIRVDADRLVTHNTAILGILGIGKTYLAFELIRRILLAGRKVIVFDITGQYPGEFADVFSPQDQTGITDRINTAIAAARTRVAKNVHEGGNLQDFRNALRDELSTFLSSADLLRIYNPAAFDVVRQDSRPFQDQASMAPLTTAEVTHWVAEELLNLLSAKMTSEARVCLVLEEAHSLVPEWNSTTYEGDQRASNGTARAILQGRKYGLGVVLVTQRTANVTKTILNQCNTIFALRTFDATGMEFLRNYIGGEYSDVLSSLQERTAVVFGRASSCETPVIVRLNDHDEMVDALWKPRVKEIERPLEPESPASARGDGPLEPEEDAGPEAVEDLGQPPEDDIFG
jgi:uncharacterized protein